MEGSECACLEARHHVVGVEDGGLGGLAQALVAHHLDVHVRNRLRKSTGKEGNGQAIRWVGLIEMVD